MIETKDLIIKKAQFEDWKDLYHNIWRCSESAKYMLWNVTTSEEDAKERMRRTLKHQEKNPYSWMVYEKKSDQAIGWAGIVEIDEGIFEDTGIAIGPAFVRQGYGKQIVNAIVDYAREKLGAKQIVLSYRSQNIASKKLQESCGFTYDHSEERVDRRNGQLYVIEYTKKILNDMN